HVGATVSRDHYGGPRAAAPHVQRVPQSRNAPRLERERDVLMLLDLARAVVGDHEERGELPTATNAPNKLPEDPVDLAVRVENRWVAGVVEMREAVRAWEDHEQEPPRTRGNGEPRARDRAVERAIAAEVVRRGAEHRPADGHQVRAAGQTAGDRRADRQALRHELEEGRAAVDVAVDPRRLGTAVAARRTPAGRWTAGDASAVEPTDAGNVRGARVAPEQDRDVGHAGGRRKDGRPDGHPSRLDDPTGQIRQIALREQLAQHVVTGAVQENARHPTRSGLSGGSDAGWTSHQGSRRGGGKEGRTGAAVGRRRQAPV